MDAKENAKEIVVGDLTIRYGETRVGALLAAGYTVSDLSHIPVGLAIAICDLRNPQGVAVARLMFHELEETVEIEELDDVVIDSVVILYTMEEWKRRKKWGQGRSEERSKGQGLLRRVLWTVLAHVFAAAVLVWAYANPVSFAWLIETDWEIVLVVIPGGVAAFLWGDAANGRPIWMRVLMSILMALNVMVSAGYFFWIQGVFGR